MPRTVSFKVSKRGGDPVEVSKAMPENLDDKLWDDVVSGDTQEQINDLAVQNWIIKCQAGARNRIEAGPEAVQRFVDGYVYGARGGGSTAPTVSQKEAKAQKFTAEQLAFLRQAGMAVEAA